jgi:CMP-N-acetylneuraminic acid synthetase
LIVPKVFAFIFARGGSKGLPRKNIRPLGGKPLIGHAIATARASQYISRVIVSTDDEEIAEVAQEHGGEVPSLRPAELAGDTAAEWLAWRHAITELAGGPFDTFVSVPPTAPLRDVSDVDACIEALHGGDCDIAVTATEAHRSPYFNMITRAADGAAALVIPPPPGTVTRRQDAPAVYDMTTVAYAAKPEFILRESGIFAGRVKAVLVPVERALDIDTLLDFEFAEFLLSRRAK